MNFTLPSSFLLLLLLLLAPITFPCSLSRRLKQQTKAEMGGRRPEMIEGLRQLGDFCLELKCDSSSCVPDCTHPPGGTSPAGCPWSPGSCPRTSAGSARRAQRSDNTRTYTLQHVSTPSLPSCTATSSTTLYHVPLPLQPSYTIYCYPLYNFTPRTATPSTTSYQ